ncbi:MAG: DUF3800 domain-containing protein [Saccharofermentans sp.]|nr:DUF3800 domain-containing protein [Saccharofermentans sp.]
MKTSNILSILIDESGDFGELDPKDPFYHVVMVLHEQNNDIADMVNSIKTSLNYRGYENHYIHVGPLIRREKPYSNFSREERRSLFNLLEHFTRRAPINYLGITMDKRQLNVQDTKAYSEILTKKIQLTNVFNQLFVNVDFRKALPTDYLLLQSADLICTTVMISKKDSMTRSELEFFHSRRDFNKNILKNILKKKL